MSGLFSSLKIGTKGIMASQLGMEVTGHNISNVNTEGYSRQRVNFKSSDLAQKIPGIGVVGKGVDIESVERIRDEYLESQIYSAKSGEGYYSEASNYMDRIEGIVNEPSDVALNERLDRFWNNWQELSKDPTNSSIRVSVVEEAKSLSNDINNLYSSLDSLRSNINEEIKLKVDKINTISKKIANLNKNIVKTEVHGDPANDYRDQRNKLLQELSKITNITTKEQENGSMNVYIPGFQLVQNQSVHKLEAQIDGTLDNYRDDLYKVVSAEDNSFKVNILNGELKGLLDVRDDYIADIQDRLNNLSLSLKSQVNEIHKNGFDLTGKKGVNFFTEFEQDLTGLYKIRSGTNLNDITKPDKALNHVDNFGALGIKSGRVSINGENIYIDAENDSIKDVINKINQADAGVIASLGPLNDLVLRGENENNFNIKAINDNTSNFFEKMNILQTGGAYPENSLSPSASLTYRPKKSPAAHLSVNNDIINSSEKVAVAGGKDTDNDGFLDTAVSKTDGSNALKLSLIRDKKVLDKATTTLNGYYRSTVSELGFEAEKINVAKDNQDKLIKSLERKRESISGVSLDEEMTNMMQFQHSFQASARYISAVNKMLDTLVNRI